MLRTLHIRSKHLLGLLVFGIMGFALAGCGDGSPFVANPAVSFVTGSGTVLDAGGVTTVGLVLNRPAPRSFSVGLFGIDDARVFEFPRSVRVSAGQSVAVFEVAASSDAAVGDGLALRLLPGNDYSVGAPSVLSFSVGTMQLASVSLVGGDQSVVQGGTASFQVLRSAGVEELEVLILATPNSDGFSIPSSVTIGAGESVALFDVVATAASGSVDIAILPPEGYTLAPPFSANIVIQ